MPSQFSCGGSVTVSAHCEVWSSIEAPIQLSFERNASLVQVPLAYGDEPGDAFNGVIVATLFEQGSGRFCVNPNTRDLGISDSQNATVRLATNGYHGVGLYHVSLSA